MLNLVVYTVTIGLQSVKQGKFVPSVALGGTQFHCLYIGLPKNLGNLTIQKSFLP